MTAEAPARVKTAPHRDRASASIASEPAQRGAFSAAAADPVGCGYGQGGKYDDTICWLDMTSYNDTQARSAAGQNMSVTLPGGYVLGYNIKTTVVPGRTLRAVAPVTTPIETRFAFGTEAYRNIPGRPSLYSASGANTGIDVTLSGIKLTDSSGNPVSSFSFVATDTEDNVAAAGESLRWTSDKQLNLLETLYPSTTKGCVPANITGLGTTEVNCVGAGSASTLTAKSTSILVSADAPSTFALRWLTSARSGIAFGVNTASVSVTKVVGNRVASTDSFDVSVKSPEGSTLATATTGAATSASTGRIVVIPAANGGAFTLTDAATPNTGTDIGSYARSWSCTRNGEPDPNLPSGDGASVQVSPAPNESIACTVTNRGLADYSDAPNTYGTVATSSGARHSVSGYDDASRTAPLMIGAAVDRELDGVPGIQASGDDAAVLDDEDGVSEPVTVTAGQPTTVSVSVTNETDQAATLAGWIDLDDDGTFEPGEQVVQTIAANAGADEYDLTFPAATVAGDSYARFRVFPGQVAEPAPSGAASAGEVEDYPTTFVPGGPIIGGCNNVLTFDEGNEGWRAAAVSASNGKGVTLAPAPVEWDAQAGNPGGALIEDDLQGNTVTELWTPELVANGYATDYTPLIGTTIQFDYRNNTGIGLNVYMGIVGANNQYYWFNFRPQITNSRAWNRIRVPMVASQWLTGWGGGTGPDPASAAPTEAQFAAALADVRMFTFSIEGQAGADRTAFDNFGQLCADFGDAPNTYGTEIGGESASHSVSDDVALRLGDEIDVEDGGQPGPAADGDDTSGDAGAVDDEDGLASPIRLNPGEQNTVQVSATNDTGAPATLAGWIDLDGDGTFETGERVTVPVATGTGAYDLTFPAASLTASSTYARFRIFAGTVASPAPTGPAATGEVEDYPVTVLRAGLQVEKTADAPENPRPGDTIDYTVTLTNTGDGGFTAANPARVVDDLRGLLDDAVFNNDATATVDGTTLTAPTYASPRIRWQGPLGAGKSVVITYSVTLEGGGDGTGRNVAWVPNGPTPGPTPDCDDPATTLPCASTEFVLPKLRVSKTASRNELPNVGEQITYTVTVRNTGPGAWTAEDPGLVDDLSDVEDDATIVGSPTATSGTATYDAGAAELTWSGDLAPDEVTTITYTFTYDGTGDESLVNTACVPADDAADPQDRCRSTTTPGSGLDQAKTSDPANGTAVDEGDEITYTLRFTNTGQTAATVDTTDDLAQVLDDAVLTDGPDAGNGLSVNQVGQTLEIDGSVPVGETRTVTYTVTVQPWADQGDHLLRNALACVTGSPTSCEPDVTEHRVRRLTVEKAVTETADDPRPGDQVTYTVSATNEGPGDYSADEPALILDDLSEVLDDADLDDGAAATIDGDPVADPAVLGSLLSWSGALAAGETVEITYTVTLTGGGDGTVRNTAFAPDCDPGASVCDPVTPDCAQGTDPDTGLPCATTSFDLPKLSIAKSADPAQVNAAGQVVTYTVVVTNEGPGDYTAAAPATFTDDLSDVLDDATIVDGSVSADVGTPAFADPGLSWSGALAAGEDATVTYQVRYTGAGDRSLVNSACVPVDEAGVPAEACDAVTVMGPALTQTKTSDPGDGESVGIGDEITYTLTFTNDGNAPATVDTTDDLSNVLDDAELTAGPTTQAGLTATLDGQDLAVTGSVPAGESRTVTYTVQVLPFTDQGDHALDNALQCAEGAPADCEPETTSHPVQHLKVTKVAEVPRGVDTGDDVTYTLTVLNDGSAPFTDDDPAVVTDDLTEVLDDAILDEDSITEDVGATEFASPTLTWTGALAPNGTATISYTVEVTNLGDHELENTARQAGCPTDPVDAGCAPDPVVTPLPHVVLAKSADPATGTALAAGEVVTYTLTWVNDGDATGRVETTDDLSDVLDDAALTHGPTSSSDAVTAALAEDELRVEGAIDAGDTVTVTYEVTVGADGERGDNTLSNVATPDTPQVTCEGGECTPVGPPTTTHDIGELEDSKSVDPASGTTVVANQEITYTLTFRNIGTAALEVDREDVLTGVLDDAELVSGPTSSAPALTASEPLDGRMTIGGTLQPEQEVTVSYTVRVHERGERGDDVLANALVDVGQDPPAGCGPAAHRAVAAATDCTANPVSDVRVTKSVDPDSGDPLAPGDRLTYTLTFTNDGAGRGAVDHVDHLEGVLDDADLVEGPDSSSAELDAVVDADELRLIGSVGPDEEVRVTYVVRVKARADLGDGALANFVGVIGEPVPALCSDGSLTCTVNGIAEESAPDPAPGDDGTDPVDPLPDTGGPALWLLALGVLALLGGTALVRRRP